MGYTWEYIDRYMTLPRLAAFNDYWADHPPAHLLMAAHVGYKPQRGSRRAGSESWMMRGLTVEQCIEEAKKPHQIPGNIHDFKADMAAAGMGFIVEGL